MAAVFRDLTHPLRPQGRQHQFQLADYIVFFCAWWKACTYRLLRTRTLRPVTAAQLPQPDRSGITQQFADFFQAA
ncbi:Uncharacterised protein [Enterobacter cloacae]|nr:Uncharacterised protein [Enterobacter cloacae]